MQKKDQAVLRSELSIDLQCQSLETRIELSAQKKLPISYLGNEQDCHQPTLMQCTIQS